MKSQLEVNQVIGERLRRRRKLLGFNHLQFAKLLGISFQQLHKYETGVNRVPVAKLAQIARLLHTDIEFFLREESHPIEMVAPLSYRAGQVLNQPETQLLIKNFIAIPDSRVRMAMVELVKAITKSLTKDEQKDG